MTNRKHLPLVLVFALASPMALAADDTFQMSLEELMNVVVTSVSKKAQTLSQTAAAVHVIQADEIRRSGATNIPEALRLAPGVQVAAIGNNKWAVSIRGQADRFSNKLLVLVDGRSVYTPLFSGVLWEALDIPLENIERIEVMRGPGAAVWGANAVNGVINIITRSPFDTQGSQVALAAGNELHGYGFVRHGWNPGPDTAMQFYAKAHGYDESKLQAGGDGADDWQNKSAGFKLEHLLETGSVQVQGSVYRSSAGDEVTMLSAPPAINQVRSTQTIGGGHLMARWEREDEKDGAESLQFYVDQADYDHVILTERRLNLDLEYQQRLRKGDTQELVWGLGYRYSADRIGDSAMMQTSEPERKTNLFSAFVQDEITLQPERWRLSLGARAEHNDYTAFEFQPNARLLWTPDLKNSAWLSLARAIRTPSRLERGTRIYVMADPVGTPPFVPPSVVQAGIVGFEEEKLNALDLGWRHQFSASSSFDLAAFHYDYTHLRGSAATAPTFVLPGYLLIQTQENNANEASVHGVEAALDWRLSPIWRLQAGYSWLEMTVRMAGFPGEAPSDYVGSSPSHLFSLRSSLDLSNNMQWDVWLRHVSQIERYAIPAYTTLDMRFAWQPLKNMEVSLVGQNLLDSAHPEYGSQYIVSARSEIERSVYVKLDWKF